jgi:hypothetical protein|tara:strand:- start:412 stop:924 length:513 start_codon:yes stop_codon:yes gene_type:complete
MNLSAILYIVILPGILANVLHMAVVKLNLISFLSIPVNKRLFGENKTIRGFVILIFLTGLFSILGSTLIYWSISKGLSYGAILGGTYALFELPNSFLKRRLGIVAGGKATKNKLLFQVLDKTDSTFGVALVYSLLSGLSWNQGLLLFVGNVVLHVSLSFLLVVLKIKKSF